MTASLMEEVIELVAAARGGGRKKEEFGNGGEEKVVVECLLAHASCGSNCSRATIVESWTLQRVPRPCTSGLEAVFLLNAIRSHLHFSQLNAFLTERQLPPNLICTYRVSTGVAVRSGPDMSLHDFPTCSLNKESSLRVSLSFLKKTEIQLPLGLCLSLNNDQWLLPSPTDSGENSLSSQDIAEEINRLKHKLPPCSPTGEPKVKIPATEEILLGKSQVLKPEERTVDKLTNSLDDLVSRPSRLRTKSGSSTLLFNKTTGLPSHSSPAPLGRQRNFSTGDMTDVKKSPGLLGSFEESALKDRLEPVKQLEGYKLQIAASGNFSPPHTTLPMKVFIFDDNEHDPLPSLGTCSLSSCGRKGYRIPKQGMLQATVFNPQGTVMKLFLIPYDVSDMPSSSQTFLRQRTSLDSGNDKHLQYLIHFRLSSDRSSRVYLHTDIRVLFSQNSSLSGLNVQIKDNIGTESEKYQVTSELQTPVCPKYSPKK